MKALIRSTLIAALISIGTLLPSAGIADPGRATAELHTAATATIRAVRLAEPLVATAATTVEEDLALAQALVAHERRVAPDDVGSLTEFLAKYPRSGWAPALLVNLGLSYLHEGHFSRAIEVWQEAWHRGKGATEPQARALVDRAVGELARLYASLGHIERLQSFFEEIGDRAVTGSATEAVQAARELLVLSEKDPRHLFTCGPLALQSLLLARGADAEAVRFLQWLRVGPNGTSLADVAALADKAKLQYRIVFRKPGQPVPIPSIVHWRVGHFAAIVGEENQRFRVQDPVFRNQALWATQKALDAEASGYFLVPIDVVDETPWRAVALAEASSVWGKGPTNGTQPGDPGDPPADGPGDEPGSNPDGDSPGSPNPDDPGSPCPAGCGCPMCGHAIKESSVSLMLADRPVGYLPAVGPSARVRITYNQREDSQPQNFNFFNVSQKWTLNWLSYVTDDPNNPGANVSRYISGGGAYYYTGYSSSTGRFAAQVTNGSVLIRTSSNPIIYRRELRNGAIEIYAQSDGSIGFPRRIFLTQVIDPQGNALTLNYDGQQRLTSLTDAIGRQTTFTYGLASQPLLITRITDPFGRSANLSYDLSGRLASITDVIGLTSSFTYDSNSLVNSLTTPYGTTTFAYTAPGISAPPRFVQVTDPLGFSERVEWLEPAPVPSTDPTGTVPQGMPVAPTNNFLQYRNSFYWNKDAYVAAGCTPSGGCDYTKARMRHFLHVPPNTTIKATGIESVKYPLENRIWYSYPGQTNSIYGGTFNQAAAIGRVLDDGTTQLRQFFYDPVTLNLTKVIDPLGRTTSLTYANGVDLAAVTQSTEGGALTLIAQFTYNTRHRPLAYTDAASQTTTYEYNTAGQLTSLTNPLGQTTSYDYDGDASLMAITNANSITAGTFTYDAFARVRTYTDSEGWTATYDYDAADRISKITYPDGTTDTYTYDKLDLASFRDRQGRTWTYTRDANRRLTAVTDPLGQQTLFGHNRIGQLTSLTDPKSNVTTWSYDVQGRLTQKQYADTSTVTYTYETTTSRLKSVTDALGQVKQLSYAKDDRLIGVAYLNAVNPTPNVSLIYDPYFPRVTSMTDGTGTTQYTYVPVGVLGALQLQQEVRALPNSAISSTYDKLGRLSARTVQGAGPETFQYDAIGRPINHSSDLGSFTLSYLGQTGQITGRQLANSTLATSWGYQNNLGDRRLVSIGNVGLSAGHFSNYQFTTTPENFIAGIAETSDAAAVYPGTLTQSATYNNLNQLTNLSGQALTYDLNGNLTSDGQRSYTWDAENRLVGITYPGAPGKQTAFAYDGLSRRIAITSTPPGGGSATTTSYLWCGERICQARNSGNATIRSYYDQGELVPGAPPQTLYYGVDQLGSARRVFASVSTAPAFSYDAYGRPLQGTAPVTDFNFAGMFYNAESGLYLTHYRAYDPVAGRWLSRDPIGETNQTANSVAPRAVADAVTRAATLMGPVDATANSIQLTEAHLRWDNFRFTSGQSLYAYADGNPISLNDPTGENPVGPIIRIIVGIGSVGTAIWGQFQYGATPVPVPRPGSSPPRVCTPDDPFGISGRQEASGAPSYPMPGYRRPPPSTPGRQTGPQLTFGR